MMRGRSPAIAIVIAIGSKFGKEAARNLIPFNSTRVRRYVLSLLLRTKYGDDGPFRFRLYIYTYRRRFDRGDDTIQRQGHQR
mmetsp:Transcript_38105/g.113856  ORF Transcript_38105/g.113856 Transcript_38105/m.113856 type:complete len:82 (-) Transcript_38105:107-352(-)